MESIENIIPNITINIHDKKFSVTKDELINKTLLQIIIEKCMSSINSTQTSECISEYVDLKIPSKSEIEQYITSKNYRYSVTDIFQHFINDNYKIHNKQDINKVKNAIRAKVVRIKKYIEKHNNGEWIGKKKGRVKICMFKKNDD